MAQAHPSNEQLAAYASGALSEGMNLLVASHLTYCAECREKVAQFEVVGASALTEQDIANDIRPPSLDAAFAALDAPATESRIVPDPGTPLPFPIRAEVGAKVDDLKWKFRLPGLHECELEGFDGEQVSLLRAKPGTRILHHTHEGDEATLILTGQMEDDGIVYGVGDVAIADHNDNHRPQIVGDEVCYCLIVMSGSMRFTGPVGRALNILSR